MSGKEATTHRTSDWPWDVPHGLVGDRWGYPVGLAFAASLILIFIAQLATPTTVVITTLGLVPVLAAAWLLSTPLAIGLTVLGIGLIGVAGAVGALVPITAASEATIFALIAIAIRLYARRLIILLRGTPKEPQPGSSTVFGLESLAQVVDSSMNGVAALNQAGRIIYANSAVGDMLGVSPESMIGTELLGYIVPEDRAQLGPYVADITVRRAARLAVRGMRPDGEVRELELSHTPIVARGRPVVAVLFRDITETNRLERAAAALAQVATSMAVTQPIERMLEAVARSVVEATDAVAASVFLLEGESTLRTAGTWGLPTGFIHAIDAAAQAGATRPLLEAIAKQADFIYEDL